MRTQFCAAKKIIAIHKRHTDKKSRACCSGGSALEIENDKYDPASLVCPGPTAQFIRVFDRIRWGFGIVRKARDLLPAFILIVASPKAIMAASEIDNITFIRIERHSFAVTATIFVAAHLERHVCEL